MSAIKAAFLWDLVKGLVYFNETFYGKFPLVPAGDALLVRDERRTGAGDVLGPSAGPVPRTAGRAARRRHQRHGHPQLLVSRSLRQDVRPGRDPVSTVVSIVF